MRNHTLYRVVANNRQQFIRFLEIFGIDYSSARLITSADQLRGLPRRTKLFCLNNYNEHKDWRNIFDAICMREFETIEIYFG